MLAYVQVSNALDRLRRLADPIESNTLNAETGSKLLRVEINEHIVCRLAREEILGDGIDVREDEVYRILGEVIERLSLWDNISEQGMVLFYLRFLTGLHRITKEEMELLLTFWIIFKGKDIGKFASVIREDNREQSGRRVAFRTKLVL